MLLNTRIALWAIGLSSVLAVGIVLLITFIHVDPWITTGTVVEKNYIAAYSSELPECWGYDSSGKCIYEATVPVEFPECWEFVLTDDQQHHGDVCVFDFTYSRYHIGDHYP